MFPTFPECARSHPSQASFELARMVNRYVMNGPAASTAAGSREKHLLKSLRSSATRQWIPIHRRSNKCFIYYFFTFVNFYLSKSFMKKLYAANIQINSNLFK
jgi:hypothetical protein